MQSHFLSHHYQTKSYRIKKWLYLHHNGYSLSTQTPYYAQSWKTTPTESQQPNKNIAHRREDYTKSLVQPLLFCSEVLPFQHKFYTLLQQCDN